MPETRVLRDGLAEVVSEHMAINDVMCAFQIVRELRCAECGATAKTTERQGMAAAREMYEAGWTATVYLGKDNEAHCPECSLL